MRAIIVDDEAPARSELRYLLEETGRITHIIEAASAREAVECIMDQKGADVVFLDISMPKITGMYLAKALQQLKRSPAIVFVTAYSEYALEAFEVDAIDYLMKPVDPQRLSQALDKVEAYINSPLTPLSLQSSSERIAVVKGNRKVLIPIEDIRFIEAKDDYSCIFTGEERFLSNAPLSDFEARLNDHGFFRVHRGYIVNLSYISNVESAASGILNLGITGFKDKQISVSRRRVVALKRALGL